MKTDKNQAVDFVMWLSFKHPSTYAMYYRKYLMEMKEKTKGIQKGVIKG